MKKKKYKIFPIIVAIMVVFSAICIPSSQVMAATTATTSDGYKYTKYNSYVVITGYSGSDTVLTIPKTIENLPVTTIGMTDFGMGAFYNKTSLTSVTLPDSITTIGYRAFDCCKNLASINVAVGNTKYKSVDGVLFDINGTELIKYPEGANSNYIIPNGVNTIGSYAFQYCANLTGVTIPNSVTSIGDHAFAYTGLTSVTIPNSVITIDEFAFGWSKLTSVSISNSVTTIGYGAFITCTSLANVTMPNSVNTIGDAAFAYSGLTSMIIPDSVTTIGNDAFFDCKSLLSVTIPDSVTVIGDEAFDVTGLTSITIPASVITIGKKAFANVGLTSITIKNSLTTVDSTGFNGCTHLTSANITIYQDPNDSNYSKTINVNGISSTIMLDTTITSKITTINAGTAIANDYEDAGITGVTGTNIIAVNADVSNAKILKGSNLTKAEIQAIVANIAINSGSATISDYRKAGIIGVTSANFNAVNSLVGSSVLPLQQLVYNVAIDTINDGHAIVSDYTTVEITGVTDSNLLDINSAVAIAKNSNVSNLLVAQIQSVVDEEKNKFTAITKINNGNAIISDYTTIGITNVTSNLATVNSKILSTKNAKGSMLTTTEIQTVVDQEVKELEVITALTAINAGSATVNEYKTAGIIGVTSNNLDAVNGAVLNAKNAKGSALTMSEIQAAVTGALPAGLEITKNDDTLTAQLKKSDGAAFTTSGAVVYEWYRGEDVISGQTQNTYELTNTDKGTSIKVKVAQYNLESNIINISNDLPPGNPVMQTTPASVIIKGTQRVGKTLEALLLTDSKAEFTTSAAVTYKWYRLSSKDAGNGELVGNDKTYNLVSSDAENYIKIIASFNGKNFEVITGRIENIVPDTGSNPPTSPSINWDTGSNSSSSSSNSSSSSSSSQSVSSTENKNSGKIPNGWQKQSDNTWKYGENGQYVSGWKQINGFWYLFDSIGTTQIGWRQIGNEWYYLEASGAMSVGWELIDDKWYLLGNNGAMIAGWAQVDSKWYYLNPNGAMATGWINVDGKWYYLYGDGSLAVSTVINGYIVDENGVWESR